MYTMWNFRDEQYFWENYVKSNEMLHTATAEVWKLFQRREKTRQNLANFPWNWHTQINRVEISKIYTFEVAISQKVPKSAGWG